MNIKSRQSDIASCTFPAQLVAYSAILPTCSLYLDPWVPCNVLPKGSHHRDPHNPTVSIFRHLSLLCVSLWEARPACSRLLFAGQTPIAGPATYYDPSDRSTNRTLTNNVSFRTPVMSGTVTWWSMLYKGSVKCSAQ